MTSITLPPATDSVRKIVAAGKEFPATNWREAILHFVFTICSGREGMSSHRRITFDGVTLGMEEQPRPELLGQRLFYAFGMSPDLPAGGGGPIKADTILVGNEEDRVLTGMIRFVKDHSLGCLAIKTGPLCGIELWKGARRGELRCYAIRLPEVWERSL